MAPFEALYGRRCRTPLNWSKPEERAIFGPDIVQEAEERVRLIQNHLKAAQSRQKSYSDKRRRSIIFRVGNYVYLRVSPMKGIHRFGVKGKLAPRYIGPFQIIERCGTVAYRLDLPSNLSAVHNVFHVLQLRKCLQVPQQVVDIPDVQLETDLTYQEYPVQVLDQKEQSTRHPSSSIKSSGVIIPKMKPLGSRKIICEPIML